MILSNAEQCQSKQFEEILKLLSEDSFQTYKNYL